MDEDRQEEWCTKKVTWNVERKKTELHLKTSELFDIQVIVTMILMFIYFKQAELICEMFLDVAICAAQTNQSWSHLSFMHTTRLRN